MSMLPVAVVAVAAASCDTPPPPEPPPPQPVRRRAEPQPQATPAAPGAPPAAESAGPIQTRRTIGETTQTVLELADAIAKGGVKVDGSEPSGGGMLGTYSKAYRNSVATIGGLQVEQKMKLHQAEHGSLPATHKEFVAKILAPGTPDELRLPMLPYYQEYAFDPESRGLVVVEFPAKKEQRERETTGAAGL
jgi:hypothetical protein